MPLVSSKRRVMLEKLKALQPLEDDPHRDVHGVLLSDEIAFYANYHQVTGAKPGAD